MFTHARRTAAILLSTLLSTLTSTCLLTAQEPTRVDKTVAVFVLAGQSNMEGKAQNKLWEHQAKDPATRDFFAHLRREDAWIVRDDVFIDYLGRRGKLTLGFGSRDRTGVELEFGTVVGDHYEEPVLLIKTAWGGRAIAKEFRPPSAELPAAQILEVELEQARKRAKKGEKEITLTDIESRYGSDYRRMIARVRGVLANLGDSFPALAGHTPQLRGFVWFQGWNDQYGGKEKEYASNLRHFIRDVRKDLDTPKLPFVIAAMGQNGSKSPKGAMKVIQDAQLGVADLAEFKGTVDAFRTDVLVDKAAEALYPRWKKEFELWEKTGSDHPYHYLGSAIWFTRIGRKMAESVIGLQR